MQKVKSERGTLFRKRDVKSASNPADAQGDAGSPIATLNAQSKRTMGEESTSTVLEERLFRSDGRRERVLTLDANSSTFTNDLTLLFEKNVAKARREHKKKSMSVSRAD